MPKIITQREKIILYTTVGVIILALAFNFLIAPLLNRAGALNKQASIIQTKLRRYVLLLKGKDYIRTRFNKFASRLTLSDIGKNGSLTILEALEALAKDANIRIIDIRPQAQGGADLHKETAVDLRTEGSMEGYLKFLYDIENSLSLLEIKRFQLSAKPNTQALEGSFSISQLSVSE